MALIGTITTLIQSNTDNFSKGIKKTRGLITGFVSSVGGMGTAIAGIGTALAGSALVATLTSMTKQALTLADDLGALSAKTGLSVQALSELRYVAGLSDTEFETLAQSLKKMLVNLEEAATSGKGKTAEGLKELGLSAKALSGQSADKTLEDIAEAITKVESPSQRAALAMKIFGKAGLEILPLLTKGRAGIEALRDEARRLGVDLSDVDAAKLNAAQDAIDKIGFAFTAISNELAIGLAPAITAVSEQFLQMTANAGGMGGVIGPLLDKTIKGFAILLDIFDAIGLTFEMLKLGLVELVGLATDLGIAVSEFLWSHDMDRENDGTGPKAMVESMKQYRDTLRQDLDRAWADWEDKFNQPSSGAQLIAWFDGVGLRAQQLAQEAANAGNQFRGLGDEMDDVAEDAVRLVSKLQLQIDTFGMSGDAAAIYELKQKGASVALTEQAEALARQLDRLQASKKEQEATDNKVKELLDRIKTPQERLADEIDDAELLHRKGLIGSDEFDRFRKVARRDAFGADEPRFAGAALLGSEEARSAILTHEGAGRKDKIEDVAEHTGALVKETIDSNRSLRAIEESMRGAMVATI